MKKVTKDQARDRAIEIAQGKYLVVGAMVASLRDKRIWKLDSFDEREAQLSLPNGETMTIPTAEVFDVEKVVSIANCVLNLGYWREGIETIGAGVVGIIKVDLPPGK
jgi:hypothetical protein